MITYIIRFLKRIAILVPGIVITYFSAKQLFPLLAPWVPDTVVIIILYLLIAYVFIPSAIRVINLIVPPKHIPLYSTTPDGLACDPINVGVVGTIDELRAAMKAAGWYEADPRSLKNMFRFMYAMVMQKPYPSAPFSKLYLFGRSQDIGFELPVGNNPRHRHHIRFWGVIDSDDPEQHQQVFFWKRYHRSPRSGRTLWVGAASLDTGLGIIRHNAQMTHRIHPDTNAERDFVVKQLKATKQVLRSRTVTVGAPYELRNRVVTGYMLADGRMTICELKP